MDSFTKAERSSIMRAVRSQGNRSTENKLKKALRAAGLSGWRTHQDLPGRPDFCWRLEKLTVFVDGCFWHKCPYCYREPKSNKAYWGKKIARNTARDRKVSRILRAAGWHVLRVRECILRDKEGLVIARIARARGRAVLK